MAESYDMVVIGAGPGGYTAALKGRQLGLRVALVEKETIGGVCLNRGCIPTKALLADAEGLLWVQRAARDDIIDRAPSANFAGMQRRKADVVGKIVSNLDKLLTGTGMTLLHDTATITEPGVVATASGKTLKTGSIVIATGSRPWIPPIEGTDLPGVLGTRQMLEIEEVPAELVIIGGGVIGQEFAALYAALGCRVTVLEILDRILPEVDGEIARRYASLLPGRGVVTQLGVRIHRIERSANGLRVIYEKKTKENVVSCDGILIATGRRPDFRGLGIEELGIRVTNGAVEVDPYLSTSVAGIYAVGDVVNRKMLAHVAAYHGEIAAENIAGSVVPARDDVVPACVFTIPQIAWVGLTEEQAKESGNAFRTSVFPLAASGKAQAMGEPKGLLKLIEDARTGRLVGAHFMGPQVSELVGELTLAVRKGMSASDVTDTIHAHPTISESVRECALGFLGEPIHAARRIKTFS
ncbi:MAG: dihydrolipoyl dehydrogenase [Desulfomonilaceae bacterium]|nr:dihydrolipoyl dehydrogenase [Desulfomonilaceae bacterium]